MLGSLTALMAVDVQVQDTPPTAKNETAATNFHQGGWYVDRDVRVAAAIRG